jgi:hypothetical protein
MTLLPHSLLFTASAVLLALPEMVLGLPTGLQNVLQNTHRSKEYEYPTDFTRGIVPVSFLIIMSSQLSNNGLIECNLL